MSEQFITDLLKQINYPGFSRDIVSFGLIQESRFENGQAFVKLEVSGSEPTFPKTLKDEIEKTLLENDKVEGVNVQIIVKKPTANTNAQGGGKEGAVLPEVKKIVAIASGKGGVGKSTMAVNLACAIERILTENSSSAKIGLMDCDVYGPSVPLLIGASGQPKAIGENQIEPVESYGIKVMSMGLLVDEETPVVWRGPMVMKTIQQFASNVEWGELDLLLIDLPPGTGDAQLSLAQTMPLDGVVIVTTPQKAAVDVARRGARMFEKVNVPILGVIENMSFLLNEENNEKSYLFGTGGGPNTAQALATSFLGEIPIHEEIRLGGDHGIPIVVSNPDHFASEAITSIAEEIITILG
ncbi:MAG: Mrp/NBP35 family ATP-binding protein [Opitutae bacterium]|jgi:ATP-binding protein involved in chromosome partitioning|nr:Mrp/NBP35 family ATP-binding protein [Opitutae bacterium]MBT5715462.1 Mrp/NBP35 family ATP-binding protein [Opitutae bacterium]